MKDGIVDRHYYDESILGRVGTIAEKKLSKYTSYWLSDL